MGHSRRIPTRQPHQCYLSGAVRVPPAGGIPSGHPSVTGGQAQSYRGIRRRATSGEASKAGRYFCGSGIYPEPTGGMTASSMCVPHTKIFPNACSLRIKMALISRSLRAPHAFTFSQKGGQAPHFILYSPAPTDATPPRQRREFASIAFVTRTRLLGDPNPHMPPPGGI